MAIYPNIVTLLVNEDKNATRELVSAPAAGERIVVHAIHCTTDANGTALFRDSGPNNKTGAIPLNVTSRQTIDMLFVLEDGLFACAEAEALEVTLSVNTDLDGILLYSIQAS